MSRHNQKFSPCSSSSTSRTGYSISLVSIYRFNFYNSWWFTASSSFSIDCFEGIFDDFLSLCENWTCFGFGSFLIESYSEWTVFYNFWSPSMVVCIRRCLNGYTIVAFVIYANFFLSVWRTLYDLFSLKLDFFR